MNIFVLFRYLLIVLYGTYIFPTENVYQSIDSATFDHYTNQWKSSHLSWKYTDHLKEISRSCQVLVLPTCYHGVTLDFPYFSSQLSCPEVECIHSWNNNDNSNNDNDIQASWNASLHFTPNEHLLYTPPVLPTNKSQEYLCEISNTEVLVDNILYHLNQGLPPTFQTENPIPLTVYGKVCASYNVVNIDNIDKFNEFNGCIPVDEVRIDAWQLDVSKLNQYISSNLSTSSSSSSSSSSFSIELRQLSCRNIFTTDSFGSYSFQTSIPPSFGPPRHIVFTVSAPGYQTVNTFTYFDKDYRLYQLTNQYEDENFPSIDSEHAHAFDLGPILLDPRVTTLNWKTITELPFSSPSSSSTINDGVTIGSFETSFDIYLLPLRLSNNPIENSQSSIDINGLWSDESGGFVTIETNGNIFVASEYPSSRSWGSVSGVIQENIIRGVNFRSYFNNDKFIAIDNSVSDMNSIWSDTSISTGIIVPIDPFNTDILSDEITIDWNGGGYNRLWSKVINPTNPTSSGYRYLKLFITRETGGYKDGKMVINEIEFFENILFQHQSPAIKMQSPRYPSPQVVTCSSFLSQDNHCYKAFDGDTAVSSAWITKPTGSKDHILTNPQFILFDFGLGKGIFPTALRIFCDVGNPNHPFGCPMTFALLGSYDNIQYTSLLTQDFVHYINQYGVMSNVTTTTTTNVTVPATGLMFYFAFESPSGRPDGNRCGSCDSFPYFQCNLMSFDGTCASQYCNNQGLCSNPQHCPLGSYLRISNSIGITSFQCQLCSAGRYGNSTTLTNEECSGLCDEGFYCIQGSTSPRQFVCSKFGSSKYFCPLGSANPLMVSSGYHTITSNQMFPNTLITPEMVRTNQVLCDLGHFCKDGQRYPCPVGVYGDREGLATEQCTASCVSGEYCDLASIIPSRCPPGFYCPDGRMKYSCVAGRYGSTTGLTSVDCSGLCIPGYFCLQGSTSATSIPCAAGRYGSEYGLENELCSGNCKPGYFCPLASNRSDTYPCGSSSVYCPIGSSKPTPVSQGYYSIGESEITAYAQMICELGFYCMNGIKKPCPPGSFGSSLGLTGVNRSIPFDDIPSNYFEETNTYEINAPYCSGFCSQGYFCPEASTSSTQFPCPKGRYGVTKGLQNSNCTAECGIGNYCIEGSIAPVKCPAGFFGNQTDEFNPYCSDVCDAGHWCPPGSIIATQYECGSTEFYCPKGSSTPLFVDHGYYSYGGSSMRTHISQRICDQGYYCTKGIKRACPSGKFGSSFGLSKELCSGNCETGHYCPDATINATTFRCPAGRFGSTTGLTNAFCSGICEKGFYCPEASLSSQQYPCAVVQVISSDKLVSTLTRFGIYPQINSKLLYSIESNIESTIINTLLNNESELGSNINMFYGLSIGFNGSISSIYLKESNNVYCPSQSDKPSSVRIGYYTIGQTKITRTNQELCKKGSYCIYGRIYDCPKGRYGIKEGLYSSDCSGLCPIGFYCPPATINPSQFPCPLGRFGSTSGLTSASCSGTCLHPYNCPPGSTRDIEDG